VNRQPDFAWDGHVGPPLRDTDSHDDEVITSEQIAVIPSNIASADSTTLRR
jgi:hypothetical protein